MKKLIIFDMDGTLYRFSSGTNFRDSEMYAKIKENSYSFLERKLKINRQKAIEKYNQIKNEFRGEMSIGIERKLGINRYEFFANTWDLSPEELLEKRDLSGILDSLGLRKVVLTSAPAVWARKVLRYLNVSERVEAVFSGEPDIRKPDVRVFKQICDRFEVKPSEVISIGDQLETDILPAKSLGMTTILVGSESELADYCIKSIYDLPNLMEELK
ncbi:MAG: HAD family hydrolase [archaeon]